LEELSMRIAAESYKDSRHEEELREAMARDRQTLLTISQRVDCCRRQGQEVQERKRSTKRVQAKSEGVSEFHEKVRSVCERRTVTMQGKAVDIWYDSRLWYRTRYQDKGLHKLVVVGTASPVMMRELQEQPNGSKRELLTEGTDECHYLVGWCVSSSNGNGAMSGQSTDK
jgi:hypothetical protein